MKEVVLALILIVCAWTDFKYRKIYNCVIGPGLLIAIVLSVVSSGWSGLGNSILGFITGLLLLIIPFLLGGMGAGDVKLLAMVGTFNGPVFAFYAFIATAFAGGLMAIVILLLNKEFSRVGYNLSSSFFLVFCGGIRSTSYQLQSATTLPYGIAIALGTLGTYWIR